ncbi:MAG: hypothetical protein IPP90_08570 [Gemmatimonadaceae bacterium]|nr:hypothetical protein [Gemmatimonadaceae bacterium]
MSTGNSQQHETITAAETRTRLLLHICELYQQDWLELSQRMMPLWQTSVISSALHLEYLDDHGWIAWTGEGTPIPTLRGLQLAEAIEEGSTLAQFVFSRDN